MRSFLAADAASRSRTRVWKAARHCLIAGERRSGGGGGDEEFLLHQICYRAAEETPKPRLDAAAYLMGSGTSAAEANTPEAVEEMVE